MKKNLTSNKSASPSPSLVPWCLGGIKFFTLPLCLCGLLFFLPKTSFSQQANVPLNHQWIQESEARMVKTKGFPLSRNLAKYEADSLIQIAVSDTGNSVFVPLHSSMRPWIEQGHPLRKNLIQQNAHDHYYVPVPGQKLLITFRQSMGRRVKKYHWENSLLQVERTPQNGEPLFRLYIDPLVNFQSMKMLADGNDTAAGRYYINTRGINVHGDIGTKVSFETSFYENQAFYPGYIRDFANGTQVIPGQGRWKRFKTTGYDYAMATGYVSYSPKSFLNIQLGSGKHFIGDGYRSLLLSDNAFSYPYARFTGWFGPNKMFQYTTIYASLMNLLSNSAIPPGTERLFQKKAASFTQLSVNIGRIAEVSIFQSLIWTAADSRNKQCIRLAYANPVMLTSVFDFGLNDRDNYSLGATFHVDVLKTARVYGQFVADDFGKGVRHKTGFQLGVKYYNAFTLKHLHLQLEFNKVNPYTYSATDSMQAYTHYNQPLAHPLGANFSEINGSLQYKLGDFFLHARFSKATIGADTAGRIFGQDVFVSDAWADNTTFSGGSTDYFGRGQQTTLTTLDASIGFMISYASNLNIAVGFSDRKVEADATRDHTRYVYVAIRTSLTNNYSDFFRK
ncbi:MAG: hypothetical protein M3R17_20020 [Bacteroidota bacterium]|nr:hypothetical protein [Bacteroidota bacterium]